MAEALFCLRDAGGDPMSWKPGYPVVIMPDGHEWGAEEGPPKFFVAAFPGVSVVDLTGYIRLQYAADQYVPGTSDLVEPPKVLLASATSLALLGDLTSTETKNLLDAEVATYLAVNPDAPALSEWRVERVTDDLGKNAELYAVPKQEPVRRREWQLMLAEAAPEVAKAIEAGRVTVGKDASWDDFRAAFWNDRLGIYERRTEPRG